MHGALEHLTRSAPNVGDMLANKGDRIHHKERNTNSSPSTSMVAEGLSANQTIKRDMMLLMMARFDRPFFQIVFLFAVSIICSKTFIRFKQTPCL